MVMHVVGSSSAILPVPHVSHVSSRVEILHISCTSEPQQSSIHGHGTEQSLESPEWGQIVRWGAGTLFLLAGHLLAAGKGLAGTCSLSQLLVPDES